MPDDRGACEEGCALAAARCRFAWPGAHQPQLYTSCRSWLSATEYSAPQTTALMSACWSACTACGCARSSASPCPSCPSSPLPHDRTIPVPVWACRASLMQKRCRLWGTSQASNRTSQNANVPGCTVDQPKKTRWLWPLRERRRCDEQWSGHYQAKQASASCRMLWMSRARHRSLQVMCPSPRPSLGMHLAPGRAPSGAAAAAGKQPEHTLARPSRPNSALAVRCRKSRRSFPYSCQDVGQSAEGLEGETACFG